MPLRKRPPWLHGRLMRAIIMVVKAAVVLTLLAGVYFWITHRDWLLVALGAWGALALLVIIRADERHSREDP